MSRVVPCLELTRACCFLARELKKLDLPTLGRPMRASLVTGEIEFEVVVILVPREFSMAWRKDGIPSPVVAEVLMVCSGSMPRE